MRHSGLVTPSARLLLIFINNYGPTTHRNLIEANLEFANSAIAHNLNELTNKNLVDCRWITEGESVIQNKPHRIWTINASGIDYLKGQHLI